MGTNRANDGRRRRCLQRCWKIWCVCRNIRDTLNLARETSVRRRGGDLVSSPLFLMKMSRFKLLQNYLPQAVLVASLLTIYLRTLAPGLTWANAGSDGGDLITAAATGGIAHPTGYPLYLLLARLFQLLPFGSLAFRTNLMSALLTTLATALVFDLVTRSILSPRNSLPWLPGLVAGYAFGLAPLIWSQAVITEVYALQTLLLLLVIYLYSIPLSFFIDKQKQ